MFIPLNWGQDLRDFVSLTDVWYPPGFQLGRVVQLNLVPLPSHAG